MFHSRQLGERNVLEGRQDEEVGRGELSRERGRVEGPQPLDVGRQVPQQGTTPKRAHHPERHRRQQAGRPQQHHQSLALADLPHEEAPGAAHPPEPRFGPEGLGIDPVGLDGHASGPDAGGLQLFRHLGRGHQDQVGHGQLTPNPAHLLGRDQLGVAGRQPAQLRQPAVLPLGVAVHQVDEPGRPPAAGGGQRRLRGFRHGDRGVDRREVPGDGIVEATFEASLQALGQALHPGHQARGPLGEVVQLRPAADAFRGDPVEPAPAQLTLEEPPGWTRDPRSSQRRRAARPGDGREEGLQAARGHGRAGHRREAGLRVGGRQGKSQWISPVRRRAERSTTQEVSRRIFMSSQSDQVSMYSRSRRTHSSKDGLSLAVTCQRPVMPGRTLRRRRCRTLYSATSLGA